MRSNDASDLNALLEAGLASYSSAEPRLGMEERILRSVLAQKKSHCCGGRGQRVHLRARACCRDGLYADAYEGDTLFRTWRDGSGTQTAVPLLILRRRSRERGGGSANTRAEWVRGIARTSAPQKTSEDLLFPAVQTLTEEEELVVEMVEMRPVEVSKALEEAQTRSLEPVRVAAIHIEPLRTDGDRQEE